MLQVVASGTPTEVGVQHGSAAKVHIDRSITFYQALFKTKCDMDWETVKSFAMKYQPFLETSSQKYVAEMQGVADGAGVTYQDILALNVRTEIAFGAFIDGCTALSWKSGETSILAQNWDWNTEQAENLISLNIKQAQGTNIHMVTEAGIIGKIGMNDRGVGCTLNAVKAKGVSFTRLPCHLALRTVLDSESRLAAIAALEKSGVASACHILVADPTGGTGVECSSEDIEKLEMNREGIVTHTNHFVLKHKETVIESMDWLPDTRFRLQRIGELLTGAKEEEPSLDLVQKLLKDEMEGDGAAICRSVTAKDTIATLFSIMMDLSGKEIRLTMGRPVEPTESFVLKP